MKTNSTQILKTVCMLMVGAVLTSCSVLKSEYYAGEIETVSEEDLSDESIWMCNDAAYYVRRTGSNTFTAATLNWNEKENEYETESFALFLSKLDDNLFLNIEGEDGLYTIFRTALAGCSESSMSLVLFSVDKEAMKKAIDAGAIKGHMDGNDIALDCSKAEQDEYISNNIRTMFGMDPMLSARMLLQKKENRKKASPAKTAPSDIQDE